MNRITLLCSITLSINTLFIRAQKEPDSTAIELSTVNVVNSMPTFLNSKNKSFAISGSEIKNTPTTSLDNLLESASGFDIRNRGIGGTQADISIRGGSFDQVLVLLNGINITDPQTGHYNLDIPVELSDIKRIELLQGPSARIYGPNAYSGVINIITGMPEYTVQAEINAGSYNTFGQHINSGFTIGNTNNYISLNHKNSKGFIANTDYDILSAFLQSVLKSSNIGKISFQAAIQQKSYGANSFYSLTYPNQFDHTKTLFGAINWDFNIKSVKIATQLYDRLHYDRFELFRDSITNKPAWYTTHNYHLTNVSGGKTSAFVHITNSSTITTGVDIRNEHIYSNALGIPLDKTVNNIFDAGHDFTKSDNRLLYNLFLDAKKKGNNYEISAGGTGTYTKKYGLLWSGGLDINYEIGKTTLIFASGNSTFRLPTYTDLYLKNSIQQADNNLKPESAQTIETGIRFRRKNIHLNGNIFYRKGTNVIDWVKFQGNTIWESKNLASINTLGVDATAEWLIFSKYFRDIKLSYSYLNSDKAAVDFDSKYALDYLKHKVVFVLNNTITKNVILNWRITYNDRAGNYTDFVSNNSVEYKPYVMADFKLQWIIKNIELSGSINNVLNTTYVDFGGLTQPGINFNTSLKLKI